FRLRNIRVYIALIPLSHTHVHNRPLLLPPTENNSLHWAHPTTHFPHTAAAAFRRQGYEKELEEDIKALPRSRARPKKYAMEQADSDMQAWNRQYDRQHEANKRRHSPVCTEATMRGYRCLKRSNGVRSQCQELLNAVYQCRSPEMQQSTLERKPTAAAAAAAITADPSTGDSVA
ncbi:unnamed protein product, partial [Ectocarpus sp. 4 AP-2014]